MIVGREKIHETVGRVLDKLDEEDELVEVDEVLLVVITHYGSPEEDTEEGQLFYRFSSGKVHVQYGILEQTRKAIEKMISNENDE